MSLNYGNFGLHQTELNALEQNGDSQSIYEMMYELAADAIFIVDANSKEILDCNPSSVKLFEAQNKAELLGKKMTELMVDSFTQEENLRFEDELAQNNYFTHETQYKSLKGKLMWGSPEMIKSYFSHKHFNSPNFAFIIQVRFS